MTQDTMPLLPQREAAEVVSLLFQHLPDWPIKSAEAFRNAVLGDAMLAINPLLAITEERDVTYLRNVIKDVVADGRMIDFGFIPNAVIKRESIASRHMYEAGELPHPFESWLGVTSWEGGFNGYLVAPHPARPEDTLVVELYGLSIAEPKLGDAVLIYDMVSINAKPGNTLVSPAYMRYPGGHVESELEQRNRGSNSLDPLVTMLRLLADAAIPITHVAAPAKLNAARAKKGRHQIPAHNVVHTKDYVSAFQSRAYVKASARGGHHASPVAHWRRGHMRHLSNGKLVPVKASKVNWRTEEELHRLFYKL